MYFNNDTSDYFYVICYVKDIDWLDQFSITLCA